MTEQRGKLILVLLSIGLFVLFGGSLAWLSQQTALSTGSFGFFLFLAYAAGMSMIILPCTLPLLFVIIPLAAGKGYGKGFWMAALFGVGVTFTLTLYGLVFGWAGRFFGLSRGISGAVPAPAILLLIGVLAYLFGLAELGLLRLRIPSVGLPQFIQRRGDYGKSLLMGLVLGNAGVACPNPLFYVLLVYIVGLASPFSGAALGFVHGLGRVTPILLLTVLSILGVQGARFLIEKRVAIEGVTGYALLVFGAFLLVSWLFTVPGWWIFAIPPNLGQWATFLALSLVPLLALFLKTHPRWHRTP
jgi:cytochrome c-type biogenesis protein